MRAINCIPIFTCGSKILYGMRVMRTDAVYRITFYFGKPAKIHTTKGSKRVHTQWKKENEKKTERMNRKDDFINHWYMHNKSTVDDASFCVKRDLAARLVPAIQSVCAMVWCIALHQNCCCAPKFHSVSSVPFEKVFLYKRFVYSKLCACICLLICNRTTIQKRVVSKWEIWNGKKSTRRNRYDIVWSNPPSRSITVRFSCAL